MPRFARCLLSALALPALWTGCRALVAKPHGRQQLEPHTNFVEDARAARSIAALQWEACASDLWASLVLLRRSSPREGFDFNESDAATKARFIAHCNDTFGTEVRAAVPDEVVQTMCSRAGGTAAECEDLVLRLWKAYDESSVESWCEEAYTWFAEHTLPKCASKCTSYFCKDRCTLREKWQDLQDQAAAYQIRYNQYEKALNRTLLESGLTGLKEKIALYNISKCIPAGENVTNLTQIAVGINATWAGIAAELPGLAAKREAAYAAAKATRDAASGSTELAEANERKHAAAEALGRLKREAAALNASLVETRARLEEAGLALEECSSKVRNLTARAVVQEAAINAEAALLESNKTKLSELADDVKKYNETKCAPALAEAAELAEKNGNLLRQEKVLKEGLARAEHEYAVAKDAYEAALAKLAAAGALSAEHMRAAGGHEADLQKASASALDQAAEIEKYDNSTVKPLAAEVEGKEKSLAEAEEANEKAKLALGKAELKMKTVASDLNAAKNLVKWDETEEAVEHLEGVQANYTAAKKAYDEATAALANSTEAVVEIRKELLKLHPAMKDVARKLEEKRSKLASTQEDAEKSEKKMNGSLADAALANETIDKLTNTSKEELAQMNRTETAIGELSKNLSANNASQAEQRSAEEAADNASEELGRLVARYRRMELRVQASEAALNRSMDALSDTQKQNVTTAAECEILAREVEDLKKNVTNMSAELAGFAPKITKAEADVAAAEEGALAVEKELDGNITAAQKLLNETTQDFANATLEARKLKTRLIEVQGEITKAEGLYAHYMKVFDEMSDEYKAKSKSVGDEIAVHQAKLANVTGEIQRIRDLQEPMEAALGPMVKK